MDSVPNEPIAPQAPTLADARRRRASLEEHEVAAAMDALARLLRAGADEIEQDETGVEGDS